MSEKRPIRVRIQGKLPPSENVFLRESSEIRELLEQTRQLAARLEKMEKIQKEALAKSQREAAESLRLLKALEEKTQTAVEKVRQQTAPVVKDYGYWRALPSEKREEELRLWFKQRTGEYLDLEGPRTYNEKSST